MPFERTVNLSDPIQNANLCDDIRREQGEREVIVRELTRTQKQNALYWSQCVAPLAQWLSATQGQQWSKEDVHHELKMNFLPLTEHVSPITGELVWAPKSTTKLTRSDFSLLYEKGMMVLERVKGEHRQSQRNARIGTRVAFESALRR